MQYVIRKAGVDQIPANIELSGMEIMLVNTMSRETVLREFLKMVGDSYDAYQSISQEGKDHESKAGTADCGLLQHHRQIYS